MTQDREVRAFDAAMVGIEERDGQAPVLSGYAAVFNTLSGDMGGWREQIQAGAFAEALGMDVRLLINHEGMPLARTASKTLELSEDSKGLKVRAALEPSDPDVQALLPKMRRGDITGMSFAFSVKPGGQDWARDDSGLMVRTLKSLRLFDVSVVTYPAYPATSVAVRSMEDWRKQHDAPPAGTPALSVALRRLRIAEFG